MSPSRPEDYNKRMNSKRKRTLDDEDVENLQPSNKQKYLAVPSHRTTNIPSRSLSSSSSSDDETVVITSPSRVDCDETTVDDCLFSDDNSMSPLKQVLSPVENVLRNESTSGLKRRHSKSIITTSRKRKCPFPSLSWGDHCDVWQKMCESDVASSAKRNKDLFQNHPSLQLRMRAILFDWLNEVCEVYKMLRETYHLTVNYIDRYLTSTKDVYKGRLQLIGITCLFIASKVEEIYPPKLSEFAYVTDGACVQEEILCEEIVILSTLNWQTTPKTINRWLSTYIQLNTILNIKDEELSDGRKELKKYTFVFPQYSSLEYSTCGQLIDLAVLHVDVNAFSYSMVAAAAIAYVFNKDVALQVSSYTWEELSCCYTWLSPFAEVLGVGQHMQPLAPLTLPDIATEFVRLGGGLPRICPNINLDQNHLMQVHNTNLDLFDLVLKHMSPPAKTTEAPSPEVEEEEEVLVTVQPMSPPPSSHKKTMEAAAQVQMGQP